MTSFGMDVGGNLLASLTWYFVEPYFSNKQATRVVEREVHAAFKVEVERLCAAASADAQQVMDVLDYALPSDVADIVASYAGAFDTAREINPENDDVVSGLVDRLQSAGLDVSTLPIDLGELLKSVPAAVRRRLLDIASKPSSPLFNPVALSEISHMRERLDEVCVALGLPARGTDAVPLPVPPQPYFPHAYAVHRNVGWRVAERRRLTTWWLNGHEPVLVLVAAGGMGKTSLAWTWLLSDVLKIAHPRENVAPAEPPSPLPADRRPAGVIWWSFGEPDGSFAQFLDAAVSYLEAKGFRRQLNLTDAEKVAALLESLRAGRHLLVLDGLEHELTAHAQPPLDGTGTPAVDQRAEFRGCVNPLLARFLHDLQSVPCASRLFVTSSLFPSDLEGLAGTRRERLEPLQLEDGIAFLRSQGVQGTRAALKQACEEYGSHPLALRVLSGVALQDRRDPGAVEVILRPAAHAAVRDATEKALGLAAAGLSEAGREVLGRLAAFRYPVPYATALAINPCASADEFDALLGELVARELIGVRRGTYVIHPVIRRYAYGLLSADSRRVTHERAAQSLAATMSTLPRRLETLEQAAPALDYYYHLIGAEAWDAAWGVIYEVLRPQLYYALGAYGVYADALAELVDTETLKVRGAFSDFDKAGILNLFGNALCAMGRPLDAAPIFRLALETEPAGSINYPVDSGNLGARCLLPMGQLEEAETRLRGRVRSARRLSRSLAATSEDVAEAIAFAELNEAIGHSDLGYFYGICGKYNHARREFGRALDMFDDHQSRGIVKRLQGEVALLRGDLADAQDCVGAAAELTSKDNLARDLIHLHCLRGTVEVAVAETVDLEEPERAKRLQAAQSHLDRALEACRESNLIEAEPKILIASGRFRRALGSAEAAEQQFHEALELANVCGYRLHAADAECGLATLALGADARDDARAHARKALALAQSDSTGYAYAAAVGRAQQVLALA